MCLFFWHDSLLARYLFNANPTHICPASSHGMWSSTYDKTVFEGRRSKLASFCECQPTSATTCGQCQTTLVPYSSGVTKSSPAPTCIQSLDLLSRSWHPTQTRRTFERATHSDVNTQIKTIGLIHKQNGKSGHFIYCTNMVRLMTALLLDEQLGSVLLIQL